MPDSNQPPQDPHEGNPGESAPGEEEAGAGQPDADQPGQPGASQGPEPTRPYGQPHEEPYGQPGQAPGEGQPGQGSPYGQPAADQPGAYPGAYGQDPYGQPGAYGQDPYGQPGAYGQQYGQAPYGQDPYSQPGGPLEPFSPTQSFSWAWRQFTSNIGLFLLLGLLMLIPSGIAQSAFSWDGNLRGNGDDSVFLFVFAPLQVVGGIVGGLVSFIFTVVTARAALVAARGQRPDIGAAFEGINWAQTAVAGLLYAAILQVGFILCVVPGVVASFFLIFAATAAAYRSDADALTSLTTSLKLVTDNVGTTLLLTVLSIGVVLLGFLACCVGIVFALPIAVFAITHTFVSLVERRPVP